MVLLFIKLLHSFPTEIAVFILSAMFLLVVWFLSFQRNLPPGPWSLHPYGHIAAMEVNNENHLTLMEYRRQYGPVFRLRFGTKTAIVLASACAIKEALVDKSEHFSERPHWLRAHQKAFQNKGIIWNTHDWQFTRKFTLTAMRDFGVGKSPVEEKIREEIETLSTEISRHRGKAFDCQRLLSNAVSNIICGVVFNQRFDYDHSEFSALIDLVMDVFGRNRVYSPSNVIPGLLEVQSWFGMDPALLRQRGQVKVFLSKLMQDHRESYDDDNIRDFVDLFIHFDKHSTAERKRLTDLDAYRIIVDLFAAGTETTSTTLQWFVIHMMYNTEVASKCRREIHQVLGVERLPTMQDRGKLLYTEATLLEVQRISSIGSLSLPHMASADTTVAGYHVPKGSFIIPHLYSCHHDHETWGDPDNFRPERWIGEDGRLIKSTALMPFSVGKRACLGESLARMEIFLFAISILQRFAIKMADQPPSLIGHCGVTLTPRPFKVIMDKITAY